MGVGIANSFTGFGALVEGYGLAKNGQYFASGLAGTRGVLELGLTLATVGGYSVVRGSGSATMNALRSTESTAPITLSFSELRALREAGLSRAEIMKHLELNKDIYMFRGTSPGWLGSQGAQATAVSASIDPYVATVFALEARAQGGQGLLQFGTRAELGTFSRGNRYAIQEREVGLPITSQDFAERAPNAVSADQARSILGEMGMPPLPRNVLNSTDRSNFLNGVPKMTPEQINDFLRRLKDGGK